MSILRAALLGLAVGLTSAPSQTSLTFSDGTFDPKDWELITLISEANAGSTTASQKSTGGNPGSFRQVDITVKGTNGDHYVNVWGFHGKPGATYDPHDGAITSLDYFEDTLFLGTGSSDGQATGPGLKQNGKVYVAGNLVTKLPGSWTTKTLVGQLANQFVEIENLGGTSGFVNFSSHPDFSVNGALIEFGFFRANSARFLYKSSFGIDNWSVTIHLAHPLTDGCEISPHNFFLPFHWDQPHITDPAHHPLHRFTIRVASGGAPAPDVAVAITATQAVFPVSAGAPPTLTNLSVTTDANGKAGFGINPPMSTGGYNRTDFVATGSLDGKSFSCQSSAIDGIGALSTAFKRYLDGEAADLQLEPFHKHLRAFREMLLANPVQTARLRKTKRYRAPIAKILNWSPETLTVTDLRRIDDLIERFHDQASEQSEATLVRLRKDLPQVEEFASLIPRPVRPSAGERLENGPGTRGADTPAILTDYGRLPLSFEPNLGQADRRVLYMARGRGYNLYLNSRESELIRLVSAPLGNSAARLAMKLMEANRSARIVAMEELPGKSNYFIGSDPKNWRTGVPHYAKVKYESVYPGIDLIFHGQQENLEFDFIVAPGADPSRIALAFQGADRIDTDGAGNVQIHHAAGSLRLAKPLVYQELNGVRQFAGCHYVIRKDGQVGFEIASYDRRQELIIDPVLSYATYAGGGGDEFAAGVAVDTSGNAYITGSTVSADFPSTGALNHSTVGGSNWDVFVTKLNPSGTSIVYSTFIGGTGEEGGFGIAVDGNGNAYVTGMTMSADFPTVSPLQSAFKGGASKQFPTDAFVLKLDPTGSALVYSTYLGGTGDDTGKGIAVDAAGSAYVAGLTGSNDFPLKDAIQTKNQGTNDAFVIKLNPAGSALTYATYLGGSRRDQATGIAVDPSGNAYVTGITYSTDFLILNAVQPLNQGSSDAFVVKINSSGALLYSTFLGGSGDDYGLGIAADANGNAYITGATGSADFPLVKPVQPQFGSPTLLGSNAFVAKLAPNGSSLLYSTYLGGSQIDAGMAISVAADGSAYVAGETSSPDFPYAGALQSPGGQDDAFVAKLNPSGSAVVYSTPVGGSGHEGASGIALGASGSVYVVGFSASSDFPLTPNASQNSNKGLTDAVAFKIVESASQPGFATISAASFLGSAAVQSIVSGFGQALATGTEKAETIPLPTTLAGASVKVKDRTGAEREAPLFFASAAQINYVIPLDTATGLCEVTVLNGSHVVASGTVWVAGVAPGLFTANANGQGVAAAVALKVAADNSQTSQFTFQCGAPGQCTAVPVDLGDASDGVYLLFFGTGVRGRGSLSSVTAKIGNQAVPVQFAGDQGSFVGLDQINLGPLPRTLIGQGEQSVVLAVDGQPANRVTVSFK